MSTNLIWPPVMSGLFCVIVQEYEEKMREKGETPVMFR